MSSFANEVRACMPDKIKFGRQDAEGGGGGGLRRFYHRPDILEENGEQLHETAAVVV